MAETGLTTDELALLRGLGQGQVPAVVEQIVAARLADMKGPPASLMAQIDSLVKGAKEFKAEHGSCRVTVGPNAPVALAKIQRIAGFWIDVEELTLVSPDGSERTKLDGPLVYYRAASNEGDVTAKDIVQGVGWLDSMGEIEFNSADWSSVDESGVIYLEGRMGELLVDASFVLRDFTVQRDWDANWDADDE